MLNETPSSPRITLKVRKILFTLSIVPLIAALMTLGPLTRAGAEDWSQFRGPNGSGVSASTGLPEEFGPKKNVIWKTVLPPGHSSPVLTRNRIFVTAHTKEKEDYKLLVIALDRVTGKLLWQREVPRAGVGRLQNVNGPASPTPVTDGSNVYVFFQEFRIDFLRRCRQRAMATFARSVQYVLRLWGITHPRR